MAYLLDAILFEYSLKANQLENQSEFSFVVWSTKVIFFVWARRTLASSSWSVEARSLGRLTTRSSPRGWELMANVVNEAKSLSRLSNCATTEAQESN